MYVPLVSINRNSFLRCFKRFLCSSTMLLSSMIVHALPILLVWSCINFLVTGLANNETDRLALMAFKDQISDDPLGALSSWNDSSHYCEWYGVTCSRRHIQRVVELNLRYRKLEGTLSPYIGNLSFLRKLGLTENRFYGPIPQEIGRLNRLQSLYMDNNSFVGEIPTNLSHCSNLRQINLIDNKLSGGIPVELTSLSKLIALGLTDNELKGNIPSFLGNFSSLTHLYLRQISLTGSIPEDLCRLQSLEDFNVALNNLTGTIPSCIYNLSHITFIDVTDNQLDGSLPLSIGLTLPNLTGLNMALNRFTGVIPSSLSNASKLEMVELGDNQFTGKVPNELGKLQNLRYLSLFVNHLGSALGDDMEFITSLTNCSNFYLLDVSSNFLKGSIPYSIANLSTQMQALAIGKNQVYGSIPSGIGNLVSLNGLDFEDNHLSGEVPKEIGMFPNMYRMYLHRNQFSGQIPDSFNYSNSLSILNLSGNKLHGNIPPSLGNCQSLFGLYLSDNELNGTIPEQVIGLFSIMVELNLSNNALSGSLPSEIGNLSKIVSLDVSRNRLSGHIPDMIGNCLTLEYLNMEDNSFEGKIPQLSTLKGIEYIDISHNKLSGEIPKYFSNLTVLAYLDLSYNDLEGPIPEDGVFANASAVSLVGNDMLCGGVVGLKFSPCHIQTFRKAKSLNLKIVIPVILLSLSLLLFLCLLFACYRRRISKEEPFSPSFFNHQHKRVSYAELLRATNSFSSENLIGTGSYGTVYKGTLGQVEKIVAVKVLNLHQRGASKSFLSECNALRNLRHRNLIKIITSCSSMDFQGNDFKAIVLEFMPNGSLEAWLHPRKDEQQKLQYLTILQRLNIAIDIACALHYLHHQCQQAIVHCDVKPSNVLLDDDMVAHVTDFGLAKIFSVSYDPSQSQGSSAAIKGSIGYVAPEYGTGGTVSMEGDVYSYGILLLELFIGKRPTDDIFQNGQNLHIFAETALPERVMKIVDTTMLLEGSDVVVDISKKSDGSVRMEECLVSTIRLGVTCSAESPVDRANMGEIISELRRIKEHYQCGKILEE